MIPPPAYLHDVFPTYAGPRELLGEMVIRAYTARGRYGLCVMCGFGCYDWWDLSLTGLPPVTDQTGTLTDQVAVHGSCIGDLREHWGSIADPADPGGQAPEPATGDRSNPVDQPAEPSVRRRTGAYARRRVPS